MSKAFTREDDDAPERPLVAALPVLAPGTRNLLTPAGATRLREELDQLTAKRAWLQSLTADTDAPARLAAV